MECKLSIITLSLWAQAEPSTPAPAAPWIIVFDWGHGAHTVEKGLGQFWTTKQLQEYIKVLLSSWDFSGL